MPQRFAASEVGPSLPGMAERIATEEGVRPELVHAVIQQESAWNPSARSKVGAQGLMQLMPGTAADLKVNPGDITENIRGGVRYLKQQLTVFGGDETKALAAYNAGPRRVQIAGGVPNIPETQDYVRRITANAGPPRPQAAQTTQTAVQAPPAPTSTQPAPTRGHFSTADLTSPTTAAAPPPLPMSTSTSHLAPSNDPSRRPPEPAKDLGMSLMDFAAQQLSPFSRTGRRNLAGMAGGAAGFALGGGWGAVPGAAVAGGVEETLERVLRGEPLNWLPGTNAASAEGSVAGSAMEQGANEALGLTVAWPFKAVSRRLLAPKVSTYAARALASERAGNEAALDAAVSQAERAFISTRDAGRRSVEAARSTAEQAVDATRRAGEQSVASVGQRLDMTAPAITAQRTGRMTQQVIEGPAKTFKERVGESVGEAAKSGPPVKTAPLRERLAELAEQITPFASHQQPAALKGFTPEQVARLAERNPELGLMQIPADHPLPSTLDRIREAIGTQEEIPFEDAHKMKRLLDDAVNWDSPAKKQVQQITKGFRQTLRESMTGHQPYDEATAAYRDVSKLYGSKSLARSLQRQAVDDPESLVRAIKGNQPTKLQALKEIVLQHAAIGGGKDQGEAAWTAIRGAWTFEHVIKKGPARLTETIGKLDPDFVATMYGDADGKVVLDNLRQLGQAYESAVERAAEQLKVTTRAGKASVAQAKSAAGAATTRAVEGRQAAREARRAASKPTLTEERFKASSVHKTMSLEQTAADVIRASALGPTSIWGGLSLIRLLTHGVKGKELLQWAAYSPAATRLMVAALESPIPSTVTATGVRASGFLDKDLLSPPPRPSSSAATPPPAPRSLP